MRTILYDTYGEPAEVLRLAQVDALPAPGPGDVLIRVFKRPVHPGDLIGVRGRYRGPGNTSGVAPGGARPGFEGAGVIETVGSEVSDVTGLRPGARVAFFPGRWAWGEHVIAAAQFVTLIPDDIDDAVAAQLHVAPLTAALLLRAVTEAGVGDDGLIAITAAGSAVGKLATSLARRRGLSVISIVRSRRGAAELKKAFPGLPIVTTEDEDWRAQVSQAADGKPIRVVLDPVGGPVASDLVALMADGGTLVSYGDLSGQPISVPALTFSVRGIAFKGASVGRWAGLPDAVRAADIATSIDLARSEPGHFKVAAEYDLADVAQAVLHAERPAKVGAVLLTSL